MASAFLFSTQLVLLLAATVVRGTAAVIQDSDREGLLLFKEGVSDPDDRTASWNGADPCVEPTWAGITCNAAGSRVTSVRLSSWGLAGNTSTSVAHLLKLDKLDTLALSYNAFTGSVPDVCAAASAATIAVVRFAGNLLSGSLPANFSGCKSLRVLDAAGNRLTGGGTSFVRHPAPSSVITHHFSFFSLNPAGLSFFF